MDESSSWRLQTRLKAVRKKTTKPSRGIMRIVALLLLVSPVIAQSPPFQPVATISEIMDAITLPYSDALVYIQRNPPKSDRDWETLQMQALMLAESGNLLMMKNRAKNQGQWMKDARLLVEAGMASVK